MVTGPKTGIPRGSQRQQEIGESHKKRGKPHISEHSRRHRLVSENLFRKRKLHLYYHERLCSTNQEYQKLSWNLLETFSNCLRQHFSGAATSDHNQTTRSKSFCNVVRYTTWNCCEAARNWTLRFCRAPTRTTFRRCFLGPQRSNDSTSTSFLFETLSKNFSDDELPVHDLKTALRDTRRLAIINHILIKSVN